jgi:hypothetical protein
MEPCDYHQYLCSSHDEYVGTFQEQLRTFLLIYIAEKIIKLLNKYLFFRLSDFLSSHSHAHTLDIDHGSFMARMDLGSDFGFGLVGGFICTRPHCICIYLNRGGRFIRSKKYFRNN